MWLRRFAWTDSDLARAAEVDRETIRRVRRSGGQLRRDTRAKVVRALLAKQQAAGEFARVADELSADPAPPAAPATTERRTT